MSTSAISIQNISKEYRLKDDKKETFFALKDINIEIPQGQVFGLIGPNGAGKSTLLKILAQITKPTSGQALVRGRMASLLEVGTGFHPELSGRENIFLNGAILGMKRAEIKKYFDEIVDFSRVEKFIDTPVKHYSSGMYVRLAFAVAAHLRSDILLIDEVLAVGDAEFQRKCISKMNDATKSEERTVIFVSHNIPMARNLCQKIAYLNHGRLVKQGAAKEITDFYLKEIETFAEEIPLNQRKDRIGNGAAVITQLNISPGNSTSSALIAGEDAEIEVHYTLANAAQQKRMEILLNVFAENGSFLTSLSNRISGFPFDESKNSGMARCRISHLPLMPGRFYISSHIFIGNERGDSVTRALNFEVLQGDFYQSGHLYKRREPGVFIDQYWEQL